MPSIEEALRPSVHTLNVTGRRLHKSQAAIEAQWDCSSAMTGGLPAGESDESDMPPAVGSAGQIQKRNPSKNGWA